VSKIVALWRRSWPIFLLLGISVALFAANYQPGTYLLGWDSTVPELNLPLNFWRFIFGVWQEYRGLGTLDGMAHTANIVYWFYTFFLAAVIPVSAVRYVTNIGAHFLGGAGIYCLVAFDLLPNFLKLIKRPHTTKLDLPIQLIAFFGGTDLSLQPNDHPDVLHTSGAFFDSLCRLAVGHLDPASLSKIWPTK
jgi:hypothetical protein